MNPSLRNYSQSTIPTNPSFLEHFFAALIDVWNGGEVSQYWKEINHQSAVGIVVSIELRLFTSLVC